MTALSQTQEERNEPDLYLFKKNINKLNFTRLLPSDYPFRLIKGNGAGFLLFYINCVQIENFMLAKNLLK